MRPPDDLLRWARTSSRSSPRSRPASTRFKDLKLPIAEHSHRRLRRRCHEDDQHQRRVRRRGAEAYSTRTCASCRKSTSAPATAPNRCWSRRSLDAGHDELIGVHPDHQQQARAAPFGALTEEGVEEFSQDAGHRVQPAPEAAARHAPKYDYLVADAVFSAPEFDLATRSARRKSVDIEDGADRRIPGQVAGDRRGARRSFSASRMSRSSPIASSRSIC